MTELYPPDAQLNALSGTTDAQQEVLFIPVGESPYYTSFYKMLYRLLDVARRAGDLRVYKDGDLTFAVRPGRFLDGPTPVDFGGAQGRELADNSANYVFLTAAGELTVNQTGFPDPAETPHLPLAVIATAAGSYGLADIDDCRGRAFLRAATALTAELANAAAAFFAGSDITAQQAEALTDGANADALHRHSTAGLADDSVTRDKVAPDVAGDGLQQAPDGSLRARPDDTTLELAAGTLRLRNGGTSPGKLSAYLRQFIPALSISAGQESGGQRVVTVQVLDAAGEDLADRFRVRLWVSQSDFGPSSAEGNAVAVVAGAQLRELTANADYELVTDADGSAAVGVTISGAATRYFLAEVDGRLYSSGPVTWSE